MKLASPRSLSVRTTMCTGKVRYESPAKAVVALRHSKRNQHTNNSKMYRCDFCSGWHIGRLSNSKRFERLTRARIMREDDALED